MHDQPISTPCLVSARLALKLNSPAPEGGRSIQLRSNTGALADLLEKVGADEFDRMLAEGGDEHAERRLRRRAVIGELQSAITASHNLLTGSGPVTISADTAKYLLGQLT